MGMILGTGDDPRLVVGRQPHRLRPVELGILKRGEADQAVPKPGRESVLGDVDLVAENEFQGLRQSPTIGGALRLARRRRGPRLAFVLVRARAIARRRSAAAPVGLADERARPATRLSLRDVGQKRPLVGMRLELVVEEDAVAALARAASAAAARSGSRIRLSAACPDWERAGRTSPVRCRAAVPSSRSAGASRVCAPGRPEWPLRRRARHGRPVPERDRSSAAGSFSRRHVSRNAAASSCHPSLSKSTARKKQDSSCSIGYTPATNGWPPSSWPDRCQRMTSSVTGRKRR